jgi:predicted transcriptional regulator of viral defense system
MSQQIAPISVAQSLMRHELFAFSSRTINDLFGLNKYKTSRLLSRMQQAGLVIQLERGKYLLLGLSPERVLSNPLFIASYVVTPAYVSFWSALHYHGLTEQVPRTVFVATTRRKQELVFRGMHFKFVTLKPKAFFGYQRQTLAELPVVVADQAKAILDSLALPEYAGGLPEVAKALQMALSDHGVEVSTLIDYASRLENASLSSRLGYLLESLGQPIAGLQAARGPVKLDPHRVKQGAFDSRWQLFLNIDKTDLFPEGVA